MTAPKTESAYQQRALSSAEAALTRIKTYAEAAANERITRARPWSRSWTNWPPGRPWGACAPPSAAASPHHVPTRSGPR